MTKRLLTVLKYIADKYGDIQVFTSPDIMGDSSDIDFTYDDINVLYHPGYHYIELVGLTNIERATVETYATSGHHILRVSYVNSLDISNYR